MRTARLLGALLIGACGGGGEASSEASGTPIGMTGTPSSGHETREAIEGSIELTLRRADGTFLEVGEQRGSVVLLAVIATFDGPSQMLLNPLGTVLERHPDLVVLGIAAQPDARLLVDAYEHALSPPFPITYDPNERVAIGESSLGALPGVPTLIVLDRRGVEVARHSGFADASQIEALLEAAD